MNPMIENMNYWNDPRTRAGMVRRDKTIEENGRNYIVWETENEEGEEIEHRLLCKWGLCDTCRGNGRCVNPNIDCCGITDDFDRDPGFEQDYYNGLHDVTCPECKGKRVVPILDEHNNDAALVEAYYTVLKERADDAAESAAERAMGA